MPKRLLSLNALLVVLAAGLAGYVVWEAVSPPPASRPSRARSVATGAPPAPALKQDVPATPAAYGIITSRNLFSPTRSDAPATGVVGAMPAVQVPKPNLYGVVLRDGASLAYLEDPVTKRVAGYRVGDAVAGGTLKSIDADRVVLTRPEGTVDVRLHDPARPRPAIPGPPTPPAGAGPLPPQTPTIPGLIPPATPAPVTPTPPQVQVPTPPGAPTPPAMTPGRRPLPPNLLRRFQQNQPGDAPNQ